MQELVPFLLLVVGMALTPGPNMMLYLSHTISYGRNAGWITVAGITSAFILHITATILGLTALLIAMPFAYSTLRYAGIAYLLYLAYKNIQNKKWATPTGLVYEKKKRSYFYFRGFIGNVLNPQTTILYFSLLPQFVHNNKAQVWLQYIKLGGWQMLGSTITNLLMVWLVSTASAGFLQNNYYQKYIRYTMSILLAAFAIKLLFVKN